MLYSMKTTEATAAAPRVVDAHSLLHLRVSKAAKACDAADAVDGVAILGHPTLRLCRAPHRLRQRLRFPRRCRCRQPHR
jgi:hypothetical protein